MLLPACKGCRHHAPPLPPGKEHLSVVIDADTTGGPAPLTVHFEVDTFERMDVEEFHWDFGDGSKSTRKAPSHTYQKPGDYTATVTAVSPTGFSDWSWVDIRVEAPEGESESGAEPSQ
jgi:PKD repeat protein